MQRKYGIQVRILLTETNEIVKSALQTIRCKEKIRFFEGIRKKQEHQKMKKQYP